MVASITRRINIDPRFLTKNLYKHVLDKLRTTFVGECTKEYGYILAINNIISVNDNNDTAFTVTFEAETLLPTVGCVYQAKVTMISPEGVFVMVHDKLRIFIPKSYMLNYKYEELPKKIYKSEASIIDVHGYINICVLAVKYESKNFRCFAKLVI